MRDPLFASSSQEQDSSTHHKEKSAGNVVIKERGEPGNENLPLGTEPIGYSFASKSSHKSLEYSGTSDHLSSLAIAHPAFDNSRNTNRVDFIEDPHCIRNPQGDKDYIKKN